MKEKILCASIWYVGFKGRSQKEQFTTKFTKNQNPVNVKNGIVISAHRHLNCKALALELGIISGNYSIEGFLTSHNRFVDRVEAAKIAMDAGQLLPNEDGLTIIPDRLYSEDMY